MLVEQYWTPTEKNRGTFFVFDLFCDFRYNCLFNFETIILQEAYAIDPKQMWSYIQDLIRLGFHDFKRVLPESDEFDLLSFEK